MRRPPIPRSASSPAKSPPPSLRPLGSIFNFKVDGTYYKIAANAIAGTPESVEAGDKYEKIAVVNGYAFYMSKTSGSTAKDYAVVVGAVGDDGLNGDQVKLLLTDGTRRSLPLPATIALRPMMTIMNLPLKFLFTLASWSPTPSTATTSMS